ncbi:YicC/YloC family endoribonuclease, partial [uncultured Akkermansia sp.]
MNSMTGFGRAAAQTDRYNILVEISGVNRKQTEIAVNVPRGCAEWDASVRPIVQGAVSRGRVGVSISVERLEEADGSLQLDEKKLASLAELLNRASGLTGQPLPLQASDLLRLDIVTTAAEAPLSPEEAWPVVEKALKAALEDFISMRAAEGANLKADVLGKLDVLEQFRLRIAEHAPSVPVRLREAMLKRLADADLSVSADDERIIREVALFAD